MAGTGGKQGYHRYAVSLVIFLLLETMAVEASTTQSTAAVYTTTVYADTATATTTTQITTTAATSQDVMSTDAITQSGDDESTDATSSPDFTSTGPTVYHDYLSTVAEGDSLTETTYSGGDSLVDTTTSLVYTSTDTTFAGDYTSADTATSSTGYQTSSQDSSSYQSPTSPYVTNYQDPTTAYADTATATTTTQITTTAATSQDVMSTDAITQSGDDESTDATSSPDFTSTGPTVSHDYLSTVAEGDSLTETTYSGGDYLVDTTTSLVYTSTDTTFAGDYTSADTATSSTGYQTSSQDSSSYQSPTSPYVTNYQDPTSTYSTSDQDSTSTYSTSDQDSTSTYSTSDQDSTSTYSTSYQDPTSTYSTSDQDPTSTYSTSDQDPTSTYSTSDQDPTSTYSTSDQDSTSTYSTSYQDPTSTYSTSDQDPTSTYSTSYQDSTSTYSTSYQDPTSTYSTSDQDPTSTYSTSDQDPTSTYSTSDQDPTSTYSTSDQDPTSTYSTSYQDPTSTYSTSYQTPTSTYSTSYQTSTVDSSTTDATTTTMIYSTSTTAATGVTTEAASASDTITATGTPSVTGATSTSTATVTLAAVSTDSSTSVAGTTTNYTDSTVNGTTASTASEANETLTSSSPTTSWPETTTTATTTTGALTNCGGELQGVNGVILSPRYPNNYPHNTVCEWTLTARRGERIRVSFSDFDLEDSSTCEMDYLELREGPQSSRPNRRLDRFCGDALPFDVTSTDDVMSVTFVSNAQNSRSGFRANWTSLCEETHRGTWRSQSGTIQSSNSSGEIKDCTFIIEQWQGYIVKLEFSSFHLGTDETDCQIHHVEVRDGGFDGAPLLGQRFCGTSTPQALTSSQNMMWIRYVTDGSDAMAGFSATYTRENPSCGSVELREQRGSFTSPLYPNNYPNWMDCSWEIVAQENHVIQLTFDSFTLEGPSRCYWDWVYVYDGDTRIGGKYCGLSAPDTITSTGNRLKVEFRSDWIITFQGFSASYFTYDPYSDELTRQYDLYPYGEDQRDAVLRRAHDKSKKIYVDTGFPVGDQLHYKLFIANKGLVSFGKRDKGRKLKLKQHKAMICPYHSDIASPENNGGVYYQLHTDPAALTKASAEVREFSEYRQYNASLVLVVTWDNVSHVNSPDAAAEQATVQLALISDGRRSFGLVYYKLGGMKWSVLDNEPLVIGFSDGQQGQVIDSVYSHTAEAFTRLDKIKGNTGRYGMWIYPVGDSYSADQQCQDWYTRNLPLKNARLSAFQRLPQCPCSWWFIWGNWRFSQWRDGYNVLCFRMTVGRGRQFAPHGKECCYRWSWWWWWWSSSFGQFITNGPQAGSATAFNPAFWSLRRDYQQEDRLAHDVCCYNTTSDRYCNMYYELRPVGECSTRIPFSFSWTWGDPHIKTLDGGEYTFNGWGEYTMITLTSDDLNFTLQGRTGLAETENGSLTNATVFTAFGAEENGIRVFVGLDPNTNDSLIAYGNNTDYSTAFRDAGNDSVLAESESYMLKRSNDSFVVTFTSEIELTISIGFKALDISIGMPPGFKNKTRGLLGNFNDVKGDDFVLPDGTALSANLTDRQIYEDFGPKWAVTVSDTVLRYEPREVPNDYAHPEFRPVFLDEVSTESREAAEDLCGATNVACIYDFVATGSTAIANATKATAKTADDRESVTKNTVPVLNFNGTVTGNSGENVTFNLQGHDPDADDVLTYHVVDDGNGTVYVDSNTGDVTLFVDSKRPVSLRFYAVDAANVQSPTRDVTLIACSNCSNHGSCNFSRTNTNITGFLVAACDCMPSWTGDDCEEEYDACEESPCDAFQTCTDLTAVDQGNNETGYTCTGCPAGFQTDPNDPTRCKDVDECGQANKCSHQCINVPGSFACACNDSYRLSHDLASCDDINECAEKTDSCQQQCNNTEGGFQCHCFPGYSLSNKGTCEVNISAISAACNSTECDQGCSASQGSQAQCFCFSGYTLDLADNNTCLDRDECAEGVCSQSCNNTDGSFVCTCYAGYAMGSDQRTCVPCPKLRYGPECRHTCSCSGRGLSCHPVTGCVCQAGWTGSQCQDDIDECEQNPNVCGEGKLCMNSNGSYSCLCLDGYTKNAEGVCQDVDECNEESGLNTCGELEQCHNIPGSVYCTCRPGYARVNSQCTDIDECDSSQNNCEQRCGNVPGSYNCFCRYGFRLNQDRATCTQVQDVCAEFEGLVCDHGCSLDNSDQAYCFCRTGFKLATDAITCLDEDECSLGRSGCSQNSECVNTDGGYRCACPVGAVLDNDQKTCLPCQSGTYGENCSQECACGAGSTQCDVTTGCVCKSGWTGGRCHQDINECDRVETLQSCSALNALCVNTQGGYMCQCAQGYTNNATNICEDVNECVSNPCQQQCENLPGSFRCLCNKGFSFNTTMAMCEDVDECSRTVSNQCTQRCDNTLGFYRCSCNVTGFTLGHDAVTCVAVTECNRTDCPADNGGCSQEQCFCNQGYQLYNNGGNNTCEWIDEDLCAYSVCEHNCSETSGGRNFMCSCLNGFLLNRDKQTCRACPDGTYGEDCTNACTCNTQNSVSCDHVTGACSCSEGWSGTTCNDDINECSNGSTTCPVHSDCLNTEGDYVCQCQPGYFKNSSSLCEVCALNQYGGDCDQNCNCTSNAEACNHINGTCTCKEGWEGTRCEVDVNECSTNQSNCFGDHVICINKHGGFTCGCETGYMYDSSHNCTDVDECLNDQANDCDQVCNNTVGSYTCSCAPGYLGSGNDCTALQRVNVVVTVDITTPTELANPFGAIYAMWKQLAQDALFNKLKPDVPGLFYVIIKSLRRGSLIVESDVVLNNVTHPKATSDLSVALIDLSEDDLTIGNNTGSVNISIGVSTLDSSAGACAVLEMMSPCPTGTQCQLTDRKPSCQKIPESDNDNLALILGVTLSVAVVLIAVVVAVAVYVYKKPASRTSPMKVHEVDDTGSATSLFGQNQGRGSSGTSSPPNNRPKSQSNSWTLDF